MESALYDFTQWMLSIPPLGAYVVVLMIAYGENLLPPIPGDLIVVFGGYLAGLGQLGLVWVVLLSTLGGTLGFMTMFVIGRRVGDAVFDPDRLKWVPKRQIKRVSIWLRKYGFGVVLANRFLSGARSVISLTVGMAQMHVGKTTLFSAISAFVWCSLIAYGGYALGENWERVGDYLQTYGHIFLALMGGGTVFLVLRFWWKKKSARNLIKDGHGRN